MSTQYLIKLNRALRLLETNSYVLEEPDDGWPEYVQSNINTDLELADGHFRISNTGMVSYHSYPYSITNWRDCPPEFYNFALKHMESRCRCILLLQGKKSSVPNITPLLWKFYDIT